MTATPSRSLPGPLARVSAWLALAAYLSGLGWFTALVAASLAAVDGGHGVRIEDNAAEVRVVLVHDATHRPSAPHDALATALTAFAAPTSEAEPDHVLHLGPGSGVIARVDADQGPAAAPAALAPPAADVALLPLPEPSPVPAAPRGHAVTATSLVVARTQVLRC